MKGLRLFYVFTHRCLHLRFPSEIWLCSVVENRMSSFITFLWLKTLWLDVVDPKNAIRLAVELSAPEMPTRVNMCNKSARAQKPTLLTLKTNGNFSQYYMTQASGLCNQGQLRQAVTRP